MSDEDDQYPIQPKRKSAARKRIEESPNEFQDLENLINEQVNTRPEDDDELDEEDLYLIRENSRLVNKKRRRVRMADSEDELEIKPPAEIKKPRLHEQSKDFNNFISPDISDEELDDFIVDDYLDDRAGISRQAERPIAAPKRTRADRQAVEVNEIFGADFDHNEIEDIMAQEKTKEGMSILDPEDVAQSHLTKEDLNICASDIPERMVTRSAPVISCAEAELETEARWILEHAFKNAAHLNNNRTKSNVSFLDILKNILNAIRNNKNDIPFIINYRKEIYRPHFFDDDLWIIFDHDNEWLHLTDYKNKIKNLVTQLLNYQQYIIKNNLQEQIEIGRVVTISELNKISEIFEMAILRDYHQYFTFMYMPKLIKLHNFLEHKMTQAQFNELKIIDINEQKMPAQLDYYDYCKKFKFNEFFKHVGITVEEFAQNLLLGFPKHIPNSTISPEEAAIEYINSIYSTPVLVLDHAQKVWSDELANNTIINSEARRFFFTHAKITCAPTALGLRQIDNMHPYSDFKYLLDKPIEAFTSEQYLQLIIAESQGLINVSISIFDHNRKTFVDTCKPFLEQNEREFTSVTDNQYLPEDRNENFRKITWNKWRADALQLCFDNVLFPKLKKEFNDSLTLEAQKYICGCSSRLLKNHLLISADSRKLDSTHVFSIVLPPFQNPSSSKPSNINDGVCAVVASDGSLVETFILDSALFIANFNPSEYAKKRIKISLTILFEKILHFKPAAIVFPLEAKNIIVLSKYIESEIANDANIEEKPLIEIVNNLFPNLAAKSNIYKKEFPNATFLEKHAISAARFSIDPLIEIAQLFEYQDDIVSVFVNQYSKCISRDFLFLQYQRILIDVVNSIGVDINRCINDYRYSNILKYIAGFGPARASYLLLRLRKINAKIRSRESLVSQYEMGPIVYQNIAGFIRIVADIEIDEDVEPFDTTRIHPESYDFAKEILAYVFQMDSTQEINCVEMMLELVVKPDLLHNLDYNILKTKSKFLKDRDLSFTMDDIKAEFSSPYEDKRPHYKVLSDEGIFWVLGTKGVYFDREFMKDPFNPLAIGNPISGTVISYASSKPSQNRIRDMIYREDPNDGNFICPFCREFASEQLNTVLDHCEKLCPGLIVGVRVKLENDLIGFIPRENIITDKKDNIKDKLEIGTVVNARIVNVNEKKFSVELSYKTVEAFTFKVGEKYKDKYYDYMAEKMDIFKQQEKKEKLSNRVVYHKKLVLHPLFKNLTFNETEKYMKEKPELDCVIRPSSRGVDRLTATIRIIDDILLHVEIREEDKASDFSLGKKLWIQSKMYEDLDEIYAVYITPLLNNFADATKNRAYFFVNDTDTNVIFNELKNKLEMQPKVLPYLISISSSHPGKLFIAYLQKSGVQFQYVTVTPEGFKTKEVAHPNLDSVITWLKGRIQERQTIPPKSTTYTPRYEDPLPQMPKYPQTQGSRNTPSYQPPNPVHAWQQR